MGRHEDPVQKCFRKEKVVGGATAAVCKGCAQSVSCVPSRMRTHASSCKRLQALGLWAGKAPQSLPFTWKPNVERVNKAIARAMYATNLPFSWVRSKEVLNLVETLAPGVTFAFYSCFLFFVVFLGVRPAGVDAFASTLLDREYEAERDKLKDTTEGGMFTLSVDGWTTRDTIPLVGFGMASNLVATIDDRTSHTTDFLTDVTQEQIPRLEQQYCCEIVAVVTDGASNMDGVTIANLEIIAIVSSFFIGMRRRLQQNRPKMMTYRCQSHAMNLVAQDFFKDPNRAKVLASVTMVLKSFRNVHLLAAELHNYNIPRPCLPCETRWCSTRNALAFYNVHWAFLAQASAKHLKPSDPVRMALESAMTNRNVLDLVQQLDVVANALQLLQRSRTTIGESLCIWMELEERLPPRSSILPFVRARGLQAKSGLFAAAHILDHRLPPPKLEHFFLRFIFVFFNVNTEDWWHITRRSVNAQELCEWGIRFVLQFSKIFLLS